MDVKFKGPVQHQRGTAAVYATVNPVLADGEIAITVDGDGFGVGLRTGNGVDRWIDLPEIGSGGGTVQISGTPAADQVAVWTDAVTIGGVGTTGTELFVRQTGPAFKNLISVTQTIKGAPRTLTLTQQGLTAPVDFAIGSAGGGTIQITDAILANTAFAPTLAPGTDTTGVATTAFVQAAIAPLSGPPKLAAYLPLTEAVNQPRLSLNPGGMGLFDNGGVTQSAGPTGAANTAGYFNGSAYLWNGSYGTKDWTVAGLDWSLCEWFRFDATGLATLAGTDATYTLFTRTTRAECRVFTGAAYAILNCNYTQVAATWHFFAVTFDAATRTLSLSVDGGTATTLTVPAQLQDAGTPFAVGQNVAGFGNLTGRAAAVSFWRTAPGRGGCLSPAQIAYLYGGGTPPDYPFAGMP